MIVFSFFFTFHDVSINTEIGSGQSKETLLALHSTMFLLILCSSDCRRTGLSSFTFHDVSINTIRKTKPAKKFHNFTFHDVSINTFFVSPYGIGQAIFTFHDVSINTLNSPHDLSAK